MLYKLNIHGHMTPVAQFIQQLCMLPGDLCSTTQVGTDSFFLHNNNKK